MQGNHSNVGTEGTEIFISQVIGQNSKGGKIFGKVRVLQLDSPIKKGAPLEKEGEQITEEIKQITNTKENKIFAVKTVTDFYYEVGFI
jgi:hypothetical protein